MIRKTYKHLLTTLFVFTLFTVPSYGAMKQMVYFEGTDYELRVYKIYGLEDGKTLMIIGGIQGDEPGGYLAADLYADMALRKGNLIVVPRANFLSIIKNKRAINGDMNRRFNQASEGINYEDRVVDILQALISESSYLLNLHEGSGFYSHRWESSLVNPMRYGQSIIADTDIYKTEKGVILYLEDIAKRVITKANPLITDKRDHFKFNNHKTFSQNTKHAEQRRSATFYALSKHGIPSFGIETSKVIKDLTKKVRYQTIVINAFMDEFGIIPENPKVALEPPTLTYLIVSVNGINKLVKNKETLTIQRGDKIRITEIKANYQRGLSVDISGAGTANDLNKVFTGAGTSRVVVRKDGFKCGSITISADGRKTNKAVTAKTTPLNKKFKYLILEVNGLKRVLKNSEHIKVIRGDTITLLDAVTEGVSPQLVKVNFLGFVANKLNNRGEDRGFQINTAKALWKNYSETGKGKSYRIKITSKNTTLGSVYVDLEEPKMDYIVFSQNKGGKRWCSKGEVINLSSHDSLKLVDVKTNVTKNVGVKMYIRDSLKGVKERKIREITKSDAYIADEVFHTTGSSSFEIVVVREGIEIGTVGIKKIESLASTKY